MGMSNDNKIVRIGISYDQRMRSLRSEGYVSGSACKNE
jgi:hypothetical protein